MVRLKRAALCLSLANALVHDKHNTTTVHDKHNTSDIVSFVGDANVSQHKNATKVAKALIHHSKTVQKSAAVVKAKSAAVATVVKAKSAVVVNASSDRKVVLHRGCGKAPFLGAEPFVPCAIPPAPVDPKSLGKKRVLPSPQHKQPYPVAGELNHKHTPEPRSSYDSCVVNELETRPPSQQNGVARTCYVDCLKNKASFAPRMCYRLCRNALSLRFGDKMDTGVACAQLCPWAAAQLWMIDSFCPPYPVMPEATPVPAPPAAGNPNPAPAPGPGAAPGPAPAPSKKTAKKEELKDQVKDAYPANSMLFPRESHYDLPLVKPYDIPTFSGRLLTDPV